jgi:hypothetical protein
VLHASLIIWKRSVKFFNRYAVLFVPVFHAPKIAQKPYLRQGDNSDSIEKECEAGA